MVVKTIGGTPPPSAPTCDFPVAVKPKTPGQWGVLFLALLAALAVAAFTQQAAAARVGGFIAWLWVSVMSVVLQMIGALFGAH